MMEEEDASMDLVIGEDTFNMNRHNTSLFSYFGNLAVYNHLFLTHEKEEQRVWGTYVFNNNPYFKELVTFVIDNAFPMHTNMLEIAQCDLDAYDNALARDAEEAEGGVPEEWEDGE